jgi:hypothetical protein
MADATDGTSIIQTAHQRAIVLHYTGLPPIDDFQPLLDELAAEARRDPAAWSRDGWTRAARVFTDPTAFLAWARAHRRWSFVVAEASEAVCAKPPEAAAWVAHAIVEELVED